MPVPELLLKPTASVANDGAGNPVAITPTLGGDVAVVPDMGQWGDAWRGHEATTNLVPNPSFETDTSGWNGFGAPSTFAVSSAQAQDGVSSLHVVSSGSGLQGLGQAIVASGGTYPPGAYTIFAWVYGAGAAIGRDIFIQMNVLGGASAMSPSQAVMPVVAGWQRVVLTHTIVATDRTRIDVYCRVNHGAAGESVYWDAVQLEQRDHATAFTTGSRAAPTVNVPYDGTLGSVLIRYAENDTPAVAHLTAPGPVGTYGQLTHDGSTITLTSDRDLTVESVLVYAEPLPSSEVDRISTIDGSWTWTNATPPAPPVATDGTATTAYETAVSGTLTALVSDPDTLPGDLTYTRTSAATTGAATVNLDGTWQYVPVAGFSGDATFDYTVCDPGGLCDTGAMTITVQPPDLTAPATYPLDLHATQGGYVTGDTVNTAQVTAYLQSLGLTVTSVTPDVVDPWILHIDASAMPEPEDWAAFVHDPAWTPTDDPQGTAPAPMTAIYTRQMADTLVQFTPGDPVDVDLILQYLDVAGTPALSAEATLDASGQTTGTITITHAAETPAIGAASWAQYAAFASVPDPSGAVVFGEDAQAGTMGTGIGRSAHASGDESVATGYRSLAAAINTLAMGPLAHATGDGAVAAGWDSEASGNRATAAGTGAQATMAYATALSYVARALAQDAIAIGRESEANAAQALSLGYLALAANEAAVAIGELAQATGINATAVGREAQATNTFSAGFGYLAMATGDRSSAMGVGTTASGERAAALGYLAIAAANRSVAVGAGAEAQGAFSAVFGYIAKALTDYGIAVGNAALASAANALALGSGASARGTDTVALGTLADVAGAQGVGIGSTAAVAPTATGGIAIGTSAYANAVEAVVIGDDAEASGTQGTAIGPSARATHVFTTAIGFDARAAGDRSTSIGYLSRALGDRSTAVGVGANAPSLWSTAFGYTASAPDEYAVALGSAALADAQKSIALGPNTSVPQTSPRSIVIGADGSVPANMPDTAIIRANDILLQRSDGSTFPVNRQYWFTASQPVGNSTPNLSTWVNVAYTSRYMLPGRYVARATASAIMRRSVNNGEVWLRVRIGGEAAEDWYDTASATAMTIPTRYAVQLVRDGRAAAFPFLDIATAQWVDFYVDYRGGGTVGETHITNVTLDGEAVLSRAGMNS